MADFLRSTPRGTTLHAPSTPAHPITDGPRTGDRPGSHTAGSAVAIALVLQGFTATGAAAHETRYVNSADDAIAACYANVKRSVCNADGSAMSSFCQASFANISPNGYWFITTVDQFQDPQPGGAPNGNCGYSYPKVNYTQYHWPMQACPTGKAVAGPTGCLPKEYTDNSRRYETSSGGCDDSCGDAKRGNPVDMGSGNKYQPEVDFVGNAGSALLPSGVKGSGAGSGPNPGGAVPAFVRTYNSLIPENIAGFGPGWTHTWHYRIERRPGGLVLRRPDGRLYKTDANYTLPAFAPFRLDIDDNDDFLIKTQEGQIERYNASGQILSITDRRGLATTFLYNDENQLFKVVLPFGHTYQFTWTGPNVTAVKMPDGQVVSFTFDGLQRLVSTARAQGSSAASSRTYLYESTDLPVGLTGIVNSAGLRLSTYTYASNGRVSSTQRTGFAAMPVATTDDSASQTSSSTGGGGALAIVATSDDSWFTHVYSSITDALGNVFSFVYERVLGRNRLVSQSGAGKQVTQTLDAAGNVASRTDEEGRTTTWERDSVQRVVATTRAAGTALARRQSITYLDNWNNVPSAIEEPSVKAGSTKVTAFTYADARFALLPTSVTVSGWSTAGAAVSRSVGLSYNGHGQVTAIDGPRTDVADVTLIVYYSCTTGSACGQIQRITDAAGHVTTFDSYDGAGRPLQVTSDGVVTTYAYDDRGRLVSTVETPTARGGAARVTTLAWDGDDHLVQSTNAQGSYTYTWDSMDHLTSVVDGFGSRLELSYDAGGNLILQALKSATGELQRTTAAAYDAFKHPNSVSVGGSTSATVFDAVGNLRSVQDALGRLTSFDVDALDRPAKAVDASGGVTHSSYAGDQLIGLVTPNGAAWSFVVDDLGNTLTESSPDRGQVQVQVDAAGNIVRRTDARGVQASFTYDALNRLTSMALPSGQAAAYTWDSCGPHHLCAVADGSGTTAYAYDGLGRMTSQTWTASSSLGGRAYTTTWTWAVGPGMEHVDSITYPSGRTVAYQLTGNRITAVASNGATLASNRAYRADGLLTGQTWANGITETRSFDLAGRATGWNVGTAGSVTISRDAVGNPLSITGTGGWGTATGGQLTQTYTHDALDRLTAEPGQAYTYDANGNRLSDAAGSYAIAAGSNRLTSSPGGTVTLDAAGNTTAIGPRTFTYDEAGRMTQARLGAALLGSYVYRADQLRAAKTTASGTTLFLWDPAGHLLTEVQTNGAVIREYAWADDIPMAAWSGPGPVAPALLHTDYLGTPRVATSLSGQVVWRWTSTAFGVGAASAINGSGLVMPLRMPGQYLDEETGLLQNWYRFYNQDSGRYIESDPLGIAAGTNTFSYVDGNPISNTDPLGLMGNAAGASKNSIYRVIPGTGDHSVCNYYDNMARQSPNCSYYKNAADICRGQGTKGYLTNSVIKMGIDAAAAQRGGVTRQGEVLDAIRSTLIAADKRNRQSGNLDSNGCVCGNAIDAYHNEAFRGAGIDPAFYGGNIWFQSVWPNPVPLDPSSSPYDPRNLWQ